MIHGIIGYCERSFHDLPDKSHKINKYSTVEIFPYTHLD